MKYHDALREQLNRIVEAGTIHGQTVLAFHKYPSTLGGEPETLEDAEILLIPWTLHGDYVGSLAEKSNCLELEKLFPDLPLSRGYGGYGGTWLELDLSELTMDMVEDLEELADSIDSLCNYPVLDDMAYSELMQEEIVEATKDWAGGDLARELEKRTGGEVTTLGERFLVDLLLSGEPGERGIFWEPDQTAMYIDIGKLAESLTEDPDVPELDGSITDQATGVLHYPTETILEEPPAREGGFMERVSWHNRVQELALIQDLRGNRG